jgi:uncharacterized membrane protein
MESLFYTISGLPVHALVVHFAVVLLPLAALSLVACIYLPKYKSKYALATVIGIFLGAGSAFIAKQSGEALAERIGNPQEHSTLGNILPAIAFILFLIAALWYRSNKGRISRVTTPLSHGAAILSVVVMALTFLVGHTGAQAVWKGRLPEATVAESASPAATATKSSSAKSGYTMADVKKHSKASSCWSAVNGNVYDLTKWINRHPGGSSVIKAICGKNGTTMFNGQHRGQGRPASDLSKYKIGKLR